MERDRPVTSGAACRSTGPRSREPRGWDRSLRHVARPCNPDQLVMTLRYQASQHARGGNDIGRRDFSGTGASELTCGDSSADSVAQHLRTMRVSAIFRLAEAAAPGTLKTAPGPGAQESRLQAIRLYKDVSCYVCVRLGVFWNADIGWLLCAFDSYAL
jgi:hypothetical protein